MNTIMEFAEKELERYKAAPGVREEHLEAIDQVEHLLMHLVDQWTSAEVAYQVVRILQRLVNLEPLSALTDEPDDWHQLDENTLQHKRCPSLLKHLEMPSDGVQAYDYGGDLVVMADGSWKLRRRIRGLPVRFPYSPMTRYGFASFSDSTDDLVTDYLNTFTALDGRKVECHESLRRNRLDKMSTVPGA